MGASTFTTVGRGNDAPHAFELARNEAAYEHGHGGYTGTIAEKDSFVVTDRRIFPDRKTAEAHADQLINQGDPRIDDKWGPAGAVRFSDPDHSDESWLFFGWASE